MGQRAADITTLMCASSPSTGPAHLTKRRFASQVPELLAQVEATDIHSDVGFIKPWASHGEAEEVGRLRELGVRAAIPHDCDEAGSLVRFSMAPTTGSCGAGDIADTVERLIGKKAPKLV